MALTKRRSLLTLVVLVLVVSTAQSWWQAQRRQSAGESVAAVALPGDIRMLSSDTCAFCVVARRWMQTHRVPFTECSIERDEACRREFAASLAPGTPVLLVRGKTLVGFEPERLLMSLQASP